MSAVIETINVTCDNLKKLDIDLSDIAAVGITNQRETTIVWDSTTGEPLHNAIGKKKRFDLLSLFILCF